MQKLLMRSNNRAKALLLLASLLSSSVMANEIVVAIPEAEAPYYHRLSDTGAEINVIRTVLDNIGHTLVPYYLDYQYIPAALEKGDIDCATSLTPYKELHSFYSDPLVAHPFVAITLSKNNIKINTIEDLKNINFTPFLGATEELGTRYRSMLKQHKMRPKQATATKMVNMLFREDVPAIIMDKYIFEYNRDQLGHRAERMQKVDYHPIFMPVAHPLTCKNQTLINRFNTGLKQLKDHGRYQKIINYHLKAKKK